MIDLAAIELFAGVSGWHVKAHDLRPMRVLGIELDENACATRAAAGLLTLQADVGKLDPARSTRRGAGRRSIRAAPWPPPCQAFSMAGSGEARRAVAAYIEAIDRMMAGETLEQITPALDEACGDPRGHLVLEPLRWVLELRPRHIALEQVRPVLPVWEAMAVALRKLGYDVWTGICSSETYGVPQTRERAILVASSEHPVGEPARTHQRYIAPRGKPKQAESLFDAPEPERIVLPEDAHLLPWVSMGQALGWDDSDLVGFPRRADDGAAVDIDGEAYRERDFREASEPAFTLTEKARSAVRLRCTNDRTKATERSLDEPAQTLAFGHNAPRWIVDTGNTRSGTRPEGRARPVDEPAPTITSRADQLEWRDEEPDTAPHPTHYNSRDQSDKRGDTPAPARMRGIDEPAPTIAAESRNDSWVFDRPATTIACDPRVHPPGHKTNSDDEAAGREYDGRAGENAIRVTIDEAAVLQSFPSDFPWTGSNTARFRQVGNAVPPLMGRAVLKEAIGA